MTWANALIVTLLSLLGLYIALAAFVSWHRTRYVRRRQPAEYSICSPRITRAWLKHWWEVGQDCKESK